MNHYILNITSKGADAVFKITYKSGRFYKMEAKRQKMSDEQRAKLMTLVPRREEELNQMGNFGGVSIEKESKPNNLFSLFNMAYFEFYERMNGNIKPKFGATEGKALKQIIKHLTDISATDEEALATWQAIFNKWGSLEDFYAKQMELRQINSNINIILRQLQDDNTASKTGQGNYADEIGRSL
ncbi:MAG: hypothetical protein JXR60_06015 [Bacteroidales bacterium]|nr:hypothetical protein [Bacteroidales bacterium]